MINMDEFLWALNDYRPQTESYQQYMISRSWNAAKIHEFETNVNAVETSDLNIERVQLASYRLLRDFESGSALNKVEVQLVNEYFTNLSAWSLSDLKFFANNCYVLPYQRMNVLLREAMAARKRYLFFPGSDAIIATVLTNSIDRMIDASDFANANNAIADLKELSNEITMAGYQLLAIYYTAKIEYPGLFTSVFGT